MAAISSYIEVDGFGNTRPSIMTSRHIFPFVATMTDGSAHVLFSFPFCGTEVELAGDMEPGREKYPVCSSAWLLACPYHWPVIKVNRCGRHTTSKRLVAGEY